MLLTDSDIAEAASLYEGFAYDLDPFSPKRREYQRAFDVRCAALMEKAGLPEITGIDRPTSGEFREYLIKACKTHLKKKNP